jgi:NTP pyrophosphatase (non-canonical NTP hydrolase)
MAIEEDEMDWIDEIKKERLKQDNRWGVQNHPLEFWALIIMEEVGEFCEALLMRRYENAREELIQITAVAIAAMEAYERIYRPVADGGEE